MTPIKKKRYHVVVKYIRREGEYFETLDEARKWINRMKPSGSGTHFEVEHFEEEIK